MPQKIGAGSGDGETEDVAASTATFVDVFIGPGAGGFVLRRAFDFTGVVLMTVNASSSLSCWDGETGRAIRSIGKMPQPGDSPPADPGDLVVAAPSNAASSPIRRPAGSCAAVLP